MILLFSTFYAWTMFMQQSVSFFLSVASNTKVDAVGILSFKNRTGSI